MPLLWHGVSVGRDEGNSTRSIQLHLDVVTTCAYCPFQYVPTWKWVCRCVTWTLDWSVKVQHCLTTCRLPVLKTASQCVAGDVESSYGCQHSVHAKVPQCASSIMRSCRTLQESALWAWEASLGLYALCSDCIIIMIFAVCLHACQMAQENLQQQVL